MRCVWTYVEECDLVSIGGGGVLGVEPQPHDRDERRHSRTHAHIAERHRGGKRVSGEGGVRAGGDIEWAVGVWISQMGFIIRGGVRMIIASHRGQYYRMWGEDVCVPDEVGHVVELLLQGRVLGLRVQLVLHTHIQTTPPTAPQPSHPHQPENTRHLQPSPPCRTSLPLPTAPSLLLPSTCHVCLTNLLPPATCP